MSNKGSILTFLSIPAILLIAWYGRDIGFNLNVHITYLLFGTADMILLAPSTFTTNFGGVLLLLFFIFGLPFIILIYFAVFDHLSLNQIRSRVIFFSSLILVSIIIFISTFMNFTAFYEDKIIMRNILNIKGRTYSYADAKTVKIYDTSGKLSTGLHYDIKMSDGTVININSLRYNVTGIKRYDNHTFHDLFYIENKIQADIPHSITTSAYKKLLSQDVTFPDNIKDKFRID